MWIGGSVVEFQLCILWLLVRSPLVEITVFTVDKSKQLSSISVCHTQVFARFSGYGNSIHNIIPLLKKENVNWIINIT